MQLPWKSQISDCIGQMLGMLLLLVTAGAQLGKLTAWGENRGRKTLGGKMVAQLGITMYVGKPVEWQAAGDSHSASNSKLPNR